ncbi:unnamed protein product [Arctogadus glacialis]
MVGESGSGGRHGDAATKPGSTADRHPGCLVSKSRVSVTPQGPDAPGNAGHRARRQTAFAGGHLAQQGLLSSTRFHRAVV